MLTFKQWLTEEPDYSLGDSQHSGLHRMEHEHRLTKDVHHPDRHKDAVNRLLNDRAMTNHDLAQIHAKITGRILPLKSTRRQYGVSLLAHGASVRRNNQGTY